MLRTVVGNPTDHGRARKKFPLPPAVRFLTVAIRPAMVQSSVRNRHPTLPSNGKRLVVQHHGDRRDFINQPRRPVVAHLAVRANVVSIVFATIRVAADLKFGLFAGMTIASAIPYAVVSMAVPRAGRQHSSRNILQPGGSTRT